MEVGCFIAKEELNFGRPENFVLGWLKELYNLIPAVWLPSPAYSANAFILDDMCRVHVFRLYRYSD